MIRYDVKMTRPAYLDLREIGDYIADDLQASEAAAKLIEDISEAVLSLEYCPERSPAMVDEDLRKKGIRWIRARQYLIFFSVDGNEKKVHILRILYERTNWKHLINCLLSSSE